MKCIFIYVARRSSERRTGGRNGEREVAELSPWCSYEEKSQLYFTRRRSVMCTRAYSCGQGTLACTRVSCASLPQRTSTRPVSSSSSPSFFTPSFFLFFSETLSLSLSLSQLLSKGMKMNSRFPFILS